MAYPIPVGGIVEVVFHGFQFEQEVMTVLHFRNDASVEVVDGKAALTSYLTAQDQAATLFSAWAECISSDVTNITLNAQLIFPIRYRIVTRNSTLFPSGGKDENAYPSNVAVAISKFGELANRHNQGTVHMPGVPLGFIEQGLVTVAGQTKYNTFGLQLPANASIPGPATFRAVMFNRATPAASAPIVSSILQLGSRTMRRRGLSLGS